MLSHPTAHWQGLQGRLDASRLRDLLAEKQSADGYFLCGPRGLMVATQVALSEMGIAQERIYQESYTTPLAIPTTPSATTVTLTTYYRGHTYQSVIGPDVSLLEGACKQGVAIPYACSSGICNTCRAKCLDGQVRMLEDEGLSEQERAQGYVLTCVGYACGSDVTLVVA